MKKGLKLLLALIGLAFLIVLPMLMPNLYIKHVLCLVGIYILLTIGFNILTGYTGMVSLGQAGFFAMGAYVSAICNATLGINPWISMIIAVLATMLVGLIVALPALRVKDKYLVLLTIGFAEIVRLVANNWLQVTGGPTGIRGIDAPTFFGIVLKNASSYYYLILVCVLLGMALQYYVMNSRCGRALIAIRDDEKAAQLSAVNITAYKIKSFVLSAFYCGVAGALYAHLVHYVSPDTFTYNESVSILCMGMIGGIGTLTGPVIGATILTILPEVLRSFAGIRMIVYGIVLVIMIIVCPGGINGLIASARVRIKRRGLAKKATAADAGPDSQKGV